MDDQANLNNEIELPKHGPFTKVKDRAFMADAAIYKCKNHILRIGRPDDIHQEHEITRMLFEAGFPVSEPIDQGEYNGLSYFVETSLGEKVFGDIFNGEITSNGEISDNSLQAYLNIILKHAKAQNENKNSTLKTNHSFWDGLIVNLFEKEAEEMGVPYEAVLNKLKSRLGGIPLVWSHGDFNAENLLVNGEIDFEFSSMAPYGYDLVCAIYHSELFPNSKFKFTKEQKAHLVSKVSELSTLLGIPNFEDLIDDFRLYRLIFSAVDMHHRPKLKAYRYKVLQESVTRYLSGQPIQMSDLLEQYEHIGIE